MSESGSNRSENNQSRRQFIKSTSALMAGASVLGTNQFIARAAHVSGNDEIKVALVGCGGRGTSAALQALETQGPVKLWAMADAFSDQLERSLRQIVDGVEKGHENKGPLFAESTVDVPKERQFVGLDSYQQAIDSDADLVILATPPGFRPLHFEAAVKAGKHVFMEKPVAVDAPGIRRVMAANEQAKRQNLQVAVGFQRRHDTPYLETVLRLRDGAIGDILLTRVYYNIDALWVRPRKPGQTEMEYQVRNWYYFNWLCGDHIVEQHVHNLDVSNWLRGMHPIDANGMGGREVRTGKEYGQIFDHHFVEFTYPDGTKMLSQCRHIPGCWAKIGEYAHGTKGTADIANARIDGVNGKWQSRAANIDEHHQEHHDLFAALRRGNTYNEGDYGAESTMTAILGRMATYSGKLVTWDEGINSDDDLSLRANDFAATPPVLPDEKGLYPIPVPGKTNVL